MSVIASISDPGSAIVMHTADDIQAHIHRRIHIMPVSNQVSQARVHIRDSENDVDQGTILCSFILWSLFVNHLRG